VKIHRSLLLGAVAFPIATLAAQAQIDETLRVRPEAAAQTTPSGILSVVAGTGYYGSFGIPGPALSADLDMPQGVAVDSKGDVYVSSPQSQLVYKIAAGKIAVYAGTGVGGYSGDGGAATKAKLNLPYGLALDAAGDLYIADQRNDRIRMVSAMTGKITTVAGNGVGEGPAFGENCHIPQDGIAATESSLCGPTAIALDSSDDIYIADAEDNEVRMVTAKTGLISTVAGSYARVGYVGDGSLAVNASLHRPAGVALDDNGNIYIADQSNCAIREVAASSGMISSLVGSPNNSCPGGVSASGSAASSAVIGPPHSVAVDKSGNVYFTDYLYSLVYLLNASENAVYTIAGINLPTSNGYQSPEFTLASGPGTYEFLFATSGIAFDGGKTSPTYGDVLFTDDLDGVVYKIAEPSVPQTNVPTFTPSFPVNTTAATQVTISAPIAGSKIYYTTDGKMPTTDSAVYSKPITVKASGVITAFAVKAGVNSQAAVNVVMANPQPNFSATTVSQFNGTTPVTMTVPATGGKIYYTTDGSDPRAMGPTVQVYSKTITAHYRENLQAAYLPAPVVDFAGNVWQEWSPVMQATFPIELP
jgi:hypothetical protein